MFYKQTAYSFVLFTLVLVSTGLYIFPSGYPQPGHLLALLLIASLLFRLRAVVLGLPERLLLAFWVYATGVNLMYWFMHRDMSFIVSTVYWTYGLLLFFAARQAFLQQPRLGLALPWSLLLISIACLTIYVFGGAAFYFDGRLLGTFNDPNQMSYWLLCVFVSCLWVSQRPSWFSHKVAFVVFALICFLFVLSSSRSAMLAAFVLLAALVWWWLALVHLKTTPRVESSSASAVSTPLADFNRSNRLPFLKVVMVFGGVALVLLAVLMLLYQFNGNFEEIIDQLIERSQKFGLWWQLEMRGYLRLVQFPQYLLFGAGQGLDGRFMAPIDGHVIYEVHSSIISPLFYYGIIGFGLLYASFYLMARDRLQGWQWLVFAAPFVYGLFTYGLRTPIFWIMLASLYTIPMNADRKKP